MVEKNIQYYFNPDLFSNLSHLLLLREDLDIKEEDKQDEFFSYKTEMIIGRIGTTILYLYFYSLPSSLKNKFIDKYQDMNYISLYEVKNLHENGKHFIHRDRNPMILGEKKLGDLKVAETLYFTEEFYQGKDKFTLKNFDLEETSNLDQVSLLGHMDFMIIPLEEERLIKKMKQHVKDSRLSCQRILNEVKDNKSFLFIIREPEMAQLDFALIKNASIIQCLVQEHELYRRVE